MMSTGFKMRLRGEQGRKKERRVSNSREFVHFFLFSKRMINDF